MSPILANLWPAELRRTRTGQAILSEIAEHEDNARAALGAQLAKLEADRQAPIPGLIKARDKAGAAAAEAQQRFHAAMTAAAEAEQKFAGHCHGFDAQISKVRCQLRESAPAIIGETRGRLMDFAEEVRRVAPETESVPAGGFNIWTGLEARRVTASNREPITRRLEAIRKAVADLDTLAESYVPDMEGAVQAIIDSIPGGITNARTALEPVTA